MTALDATRRLRRAGATRLAGAALLALVSLAALAAPLVAPHDPRAQFRDRIYAPPMLPHVVDHDGTWHRPFVYGCRLIDRLEGIYEEDRSRRIPLKWFSGGKLVQAATELDGPWLLLGGDRYGRDVWSRLVHGARISLGLALVACLGALAIGVAVGGVAGYVGGTVDELLMRFTELVLVLPAIYVVLALRAAMPLVLPPATVFFLMAGIFALVGWPYLARGVRAIVSAERDRDYAAAARSLGASHARLLFRHLLPASRGFVGTQVTLLIPAFIIAEATLSYVGLGFPDEVATWGSMLHEAASVAAISEFPWTVSPAAAIFAVVLAVNLTVGQQARTSM
ncbi:MAG: ABC transporter permease [Vicinamibacterales bacterium]